MQVTAVGADGAGEVSFDGIRQAVNLSLVENPRPGDYVIVHAGFAIEKLDVAEADERIAMFRELAGLNAGPAP
jgi:hydrogenase expression/formation protein HypC